MKYLLICILNAITLPITIAQNTNSTVTDSLAEQDFYVIKDIAIPQDIDLEIGGMALMDDDKLAVSTRHGEVWVISNPYMKDGLLPNYRLFASGLHESLGLAYYNGDLYTTQRPELTRLRDVNGDGVADEYKTIYSFEITGNYHEYAYGPVFDKEGNMYVNLNLGWFGDHMESRVKWRGWMLKISQEGEMTPFAAGYRSPAGLAIDKNDNLFYSENQGGWQGSGHLTQVKKGDFLGHPASLKWADLPESPVKLREQDIPNFGKPRSEVAKEVPGITNTSVWIPHAIMGVSTSAILIDEDGNMGPFEGQLFVGDQGQSNINRVFLEKVNGEFQGAVFPFRAGFSSGVFRLSWGSDGSMFVGMTARGWGSTGGGLFGLQRLVWNEKNPFEIKTIKAKPDGFELEFTEPVDEKSAKDASSYNVSSFNYKYWSTYGSPVINSEDCSLEAIIMSPDHKTVRLIMNNLREGYIHQIMAGGIMSEKQAPLLHSNAYYTLTNIPQGKKVLITAQNRISKVSAPDKLKDELSSGKKSAVKEQDEKSMSTTKTKELNKPTLVEVKPLLEKYNCLACHNPQKKVIGPSYAEISEREYTMKNIIELIHNPKPENWPDYPTAMPPMPDIPKADEEKIAEWIISLAK